MNKLLYILPLVIFASCMKDPEPPMHSLRFYNLSTTHSIYDAKVGEFANYLPSGYVTTHEFASEIKPDTLTDYKEIPHDNLMVIAWTIDRYVDSLLVDSNFVQIKKDTVLEIVEYFAVTAEGTHTWTAYIDTSGLYVRELSEP